MSQLELDDALNSDSLDSEQTPLDIPAHSRRVSTLVQDSAIEYLSSQVTKGKIVLQPEFQRNFVWGTAKASRLVESILLNIPIPVIYVAESNGGKQEVVDGQQRLTSLHAFITGGFPKANGLKQDFKLTGLQVLHELNGKRFVDLDSDTQAAIENATLRVIVIKADSHPDVKFEVFERLNLGAEKLNDQELRNCIYRGSYNNLLHDLATNSTFLNIQGVRETHTRMADRQLILRFLALYRLTHLHYKGNMKQVMNRELEERRNPPESELKKLRELFESCVDMAWTVFGNKAFRRFQAGNEHNQDGSWEERLNFALWDTLMYGFSFYSKSDIIPNADRIREEFLDVMTNDPTFAEYVASTGDKAERLKYRAEVWRNRLSQVVGPARSDPRTFTSKLKKQLFDADPTCALCKQQILNLDDAEVDHVKHYWRGGKTIPENAQLTHRYCNRAKGSN